MIGDWLFLGILFFLALTGFLLESFRIAELDPDFEVWSPLGWAAGQGFRSLGLTGDAAQSAHFAQWWVHGVAALAFVASIPFYAGASALAPWKASACPVAHCSKVRVCLPVISSASGESAG